MIAAVAALHLEVRFPQSLEDAFGFVLRVDVDVVCLHESAYGEVLSLPERPVGAKREGIASADGLASRLPPRLHELIAVEEPEETAHKEQQDLVDRAWDRERRESRAPPQGSRDPAVTDDDLHGADQSANESACASHAANSSLRVAAFERARRRLTARARLAVAPTRAAATTAATSTEPASLDLRILGIRRILKADDDPSACMIASRCGGPGAAAIGASDDEELGLLGSVPAGPARGPDRGGPSGIDRECGDGRT